MPVEFCDSKSELFCAGEALLALLPVVLFGFLGYQSYQNAQKITAYQTTSYTIRHIAKLLLSFLLSGIAATFAIAYPIRNATFAVETELVWILDTLLWIINAYLLRMEYKKLGSTSIYLRCAWISALVCHAFLIVMSDIRAHDEASFTDFDLEAIWFIYLAGVAILVIVGYVFAEDFTPESVNDSFTAFAETGEANIKLDDHSMQLLSGARRISVSSSSENHGVVAAGQIMPNQVIESKPVRDVSPIRQKAVDVPAEKPVEKPVEERKSSRTEEKVAASVAPAKGSGAYLQENLKLMEKIEVSGWENIMRGERSAIVYVIEFDLNRQKFVAKRSLSEFGQFISEMSKKYPAINFPERPIRTSTGEDEKVLRERAAIFDKFLNICLKNELFTSRFAQFLTPLSEIPIFGKTPSTSSEKRSSRRSKQKAGEVISQDKMDLTSKDDSEVSFYADSLAASYQSSSSRAQTLLGENIIPDYAANERTQSTSQIKIESRKKDEKFYNVEALAAFFQGTQKDTYYKFRIREATSGDVLELSKRYSEFKVLDESLREYYKKDAVSLPALPYKGHLSFMISKRDTRVIEYRKIALKTYLQTLLNDKATQGNKLLKDFISS